MPPVKDFRDLIVWQRSVDFAVEVYRLTKRFPDDERFGMTAQLRRAAVSVSSNIAEGSARGSLKERRHFYGISRASLKEAESLLILSQRLAFLVESDAKAAVGYAEETGRMLTRLRQKLRGR